MIGSVGWHNQMRDCGERGWSGNLSANTVHSRGLKGFGVKKRDDNDNVGSGAEAAVGANLLERGSRC
jgi:hypothetical protein